jgi:aminoglycoside phosphotransferase (APT) family kinase protein
MDTGDFTELRSDEGINLSILKGIIAPLLNEGTADHIEIKRFSGGYSNLTYLIRVNDLHELVLRTAPKGANVKSGHDMSREYKILKKIKPVLESVPQVYLFSDDHRVTGADFYLMEKMDGYILRAGLPESELPEAPKMSRMAESFISKFAEIHLLDVKSAGLDDIGFPENYISRQITGWAKRYEAALTGDLPEMDSLIKWLTGHISESGPAGLLHNDFKYDNIVYDHTGKILAVLDWEMSTIGDPLMDLGSSLAYWSDADDPDWFKALNLNLTTLPGNPDREGLVHAYALATGKEPGNGVFWYAYGLLKLAVIAQQIYSRYTRGLTLDPRFAHLDKAVKACVVMALQAVQRCRISNLFTV